MHQSEKHLFLVIFNLFDSDNMILAHSCLKYVIEFSLGSSVLKMYLRDKAKSGQRVGDLR